MDSIFLSAMDYFLQVTEKRNKKQNSIEERYFKLFSNKEIGVLFLEYFLLLSRKEVLNPFKF